MGTENKLKVLWICNLIPPFIAPAVQKVGTNKEGWITGIASQVQQNDNITLAVAFPTEAEENLHGTYGNIAFYGFYENSQHPEDYDKSLEAALGLICEEFHPDVIHCFGTEFPHTLALLRMKEWNDKVLIHLQGIVERCAEVYYAGLPEEVTERATFRDVIKKDSIWQQKEKYEKRAAHEREVLMLAKQVCGRTVFDKEYMSKINPSCSYHTVNEILRPQFYGPTWNRENVQPHSIFVAQGNYPLKGLHYVLQALVKVKETYPDVKLKVAGDKITAYKTIKDKLKISSYGKYLLDFVKENHLEENVEFVGQKNADEMLAMYLEANVYVISSVVENSPNSLGEAMILGLPCIAARVGGIPSLAEDGNEVLMYEPEDTTQLAEHIIDIFEKDEMAKELGNKARARALLTHDAVANYKMLCWVYDSIAKSR